MDFGTLEFLKIVVVSVVVAAVLYWALNHALRGKRALALLPNISHRLRFAARQVAVLIFSQSRAGPDR